MKNLFNLFVGLFLLVSICSQAAVTLRYSNKDSKNHILKVKMSGSTKEVKFESSRTASVTIQGSSTEAVIVTTSGNVTVKNGNTIEIKDGKITVK